MDSEKTIGPAGAAEGNPKLASCLWGAEIQFRFEFVGFFCKQKWTVWMDGLLSHLCHPIFLNQFFKIPWKSRKLFGAFGKRVKVAGKTARFLQSWKLQRMFSSSSRSLNLLTLLGTITYSLPVGTFESMIFLFPRWDMLVPWRVKAPDSSGGMGTCHLG